MLFSIRHMLRFRYDRHVFVEPLTIRLSPRSDLGQRLIRFRLSVDPEPAGMSQSLELDGNCVSYAWFDGMHDTVTFTAESDVETFRSNPFDFILSPLEADDLPMTYLDPYQTLLEPYLTRHEPAHDIDDFADDMSSQSCGKTLPFVQALCQTIAREFEKINRGSGDPLHPSQTLADKRGACRDLAVLFMDVCRVKGLATRFVSGYSAAVDRHEERELHAWAEVFLPGGGWRGYDPSQGVAVADQHVAVASSALPQGAAPVHGTFRGTGVVSALEYEVDISTSPGGSQSRDTPRAL